jgi:FdhD protein
LVRQREIEKRRIKTITPDTQRTQIDLLAVEEPLAIRLAFTDAQGQSRHERIAITMRTPGDDFSLAAGFLWSEGFLQHPRDITQMTYCLQEQDTIPYLQDPLPLESIDTSSASQSLEGIDAEEASKTPEKRGEEQQYNVVTIHLREGVEVDLAGLQRNTYTTSSCGICGKASLEAVAAMMESCPLPTKEGASWRIQRSAIMALPHQLRERQEVFQKTGGLHAAALFSNEGTLLSLREDIGRHNAVDKVVGAALLEGRLPLDAYGLLVSGRASFELVQKAVRAGLPMLVAIGAPSHLAVHLARQHNLSLIGFARSDRFNLYAGGERVL